MVGFGAFGTHVLRKLRHDFRFNAEHLLFPVATMFASHGGAVHVESSVCCFTKRVFCYLMQHGNRMNSYC